MRYLIVSDIHGNREALDVVSAHTQDRYDRLLCLGDIVGYGPDPGYCVDWIRAQRDCLVIRGNHDKAAIGEANLEWFNPAAQYSALWTTAALTADQLEWLRTLDRGPRQLSGSHGAVPDIWFCHGSPGDEDEYVGTTAEALTQFRRAPLASPGAICFFGHTHWQGGFSVPKATRGRVSELPGTPREQQTASLPLDPLTSYLINPGAVGQPRDHDPRAAYAFFDDETRVVTYERIAYPFAITQQKIRTAGLPERLATRLAEGR